MSSYQQEFLASVYIEIQELIKEHWQEIAVNKSKIKLNPDWDAYEELEKNNRLKIFTAREDGKLVGYFVVITGVNIHYKDHMFAQNDVLYLSKEHRKGFTGIKLIKFAERCLKEDGISVLNINTKAHKPFDKLLDYMRYNMVERVYQKYIGD